MGVPKNCTPVGNTAFCSVVVPKGEKDPDGANLCQEKKAVDGQVVRVCLFPDPAKVQELAPEQLGSGLGGSGVGDEMPRLSQVLKERENHWYSGFLNLFSSDNDEGSVDVNKQLMSVDVDEEDSPGWTDPSAKPFGPRLERPKPQALAPSAPRPAAPVGDKEIEVASVRVPVREIDGKKVVLQQDVGAALLSSFPIFSQLQGISQKLALGAATDLAEEKLQEDPSAKVVVLTQAELTARINIVLGAVGRMQESDPQPKAADQGQTAAPDKPPQGGSRGSTGKTGGAGRKGKPKVKKSDDDGW